MQKVNNQGKKKRTKVNKKQNEYREKENQNNSEEEVEGMKKKRMKNEKIKK